MKIKIGDTLYEVTPNQPVMVILSPADKANIANMLPDATKYAEFHDDDRKDDEGRREWMRSGL